MTAQATVTLPEPIHMLDEVRGLHIPKAFINMVDPEAWDIGMDQAEDLQDPEGEYYWDTWDEVLMSASFKDRHGQLWTLHQDGGLWAVPADATKEWWSIFFAQ